MSDVNGCCIRAPGRLVPGLVQDGSPERSKPLSLAALWKQTSPPRFGVDPINGQPLLLPAKHHPLCHLLLTLVELHIAHASSPCCAIFSLLESNRAVPVELAQASPLIVPEGDPLGKAQSPLNGPFVVQKLDMPSFLPHDIDHNQPSKVTSNGHRQSHYVDEATCPVEITSGSWPKYGSSPLNGAHTNGLDGSIFSLPNGRGSESGSGREGKPSTEESMLSMNSAGSSAVENERRPIDIPGSLPLDGEEGYFINTVNSSEHAPTRSSVVRPPTSVPSDVLPATSGRASISTVPGPIISPLPPVIETTPGQTQHGVGDGMLRVPPSQHRASSPPAFSHTSSSMASSSSIAAPSRLVHRHTLEVPKTGARTSKDGLSQTSEDGVVSASGRFSPTTQQRRRGSSQLMRRNTRSIHSDMHLDEVPQDEDAARWAEAIKLKRASKRKRDEVDDDRVVVGTKVDQNHVNWVTAYNMLTGIRFVVSRTNAKIDRELTDADFQAKHKFSFDITGNELTPSAKYDFKFKDYAPWVFRHLRSHFRLDPADYLVSLTSKYILSELGSPGKSGSFFYFSRDYKYIIKTIHHAEHKFLRKILRKYYDHVQANPNTLLSQFYGLHRVKIPYGRKIHFVVMNNLFPPHRDIHRTFDLKGSTIGRDFREEDLEKNPRATLKDLNWLRRNLHLEFGPDKKEAFIAQMQRDVELLKRLKIMDYSLLVGIHDLERGNEENLRDKTLQVFQPGGEKAQEPLPNVLMRTPSKLENARKAKELRLLIKNEKPIPIDQTLNKMPDEMLDQNKKEGYFYSDDGGFRATHEDNRPGEEIYYLGIIDCLTHYSLIKKMEHFWKGLNSTESQISAIPPERYGDRFVRFISGITKTRERAEIEKHQQLPSPTLVDASATDIVQSVEGTLDDPKLTGVNLLRDKTATNSSDPPGTDAVMARAEKAAEKSKRKGGNEKEVPDRSISAVRNVDGERGDMVTLPVIGEAAESGSANSRTPTPNHDLTPRRSGEDFRDYAATIGNAEMPSQSLGEVPPPTPPKTESNGQFRKSENINRGRERSPVSPPTPPKDEVRRVPSLDKELPSLPRASTNLSASPTRAQPEEMEGLRSRLEKMSA